MTVKSAIAQIVSALDKTEKTHLTKIVYDGSDVLFITNASIGDATKSAGLVVDEVEEWLAKNDPANAREGPPSR